jgi:multicomponent Na+:H+ antiporter subunit F
VANTILQTSFFISIVAIFIAMIRLVKGPTTVDRVVAMDALTIITISLIVFIAHLTGRFIYVDVSIVYALLSFLGVLAYARFKEGGL